ncbi:MAG: hypothetical protein JSW52_01430 [Candidatus Coatesbacteria bacterium]|nr:MAG: hypothetical protein JSW52_01430 [Candidatus Coatesbacteria bacterium]
MLETKGRPRETLELLSNRINLLEGVEKVLMKMYLENGSSVRQMARLTGVSETTMARRIRKMTERLMDGQYINCLRCRSEFTKTELAIAKDYFLMGISMRRIAANRRSTYYFVRETLKKIRGFLESGK